jgi:hypothetical protein
VVSFSVCCIKSQRLTFDSVGKPEAIEFDESGGWHYSIPNQAMKHLYMFVIDMGVAVLHKYGVGGTL